MKTKYFGLWSTNSSFILSPYEYTNKKEAIKDIKEICRGNIASGGTGQWQVENGKGELIASGTIIAKW